MAPPVSRGPLSVGFDWAARVTTVGLEFVLPALGGVYLDRWWNTQPWLTLTGALLGFAVGMMHLLRIARGGKRPT